MNEQLIKLAARQGYVTTANAEALGVHRQQLTRLERGGRLVRTVRGVYLPDEPRTPEQSHAAATRAVLDADPFAAASHHSALTLHGVTLFDVPWTQVHVLDPRRSSIQHESLHRHVLRPGDQIVDVGDQRAAAVPLALCQVAARFGLVPGLVAIDHALHLDLCTTDDLAAVLASGRLRRGIGAARRAVELADGRAESPGESRLRAIMAAGPFHYDAQVNVGGPGAGYRVDLLIDGRVVVEFDGDVKYAGEDGPRILKAEKRREDWIRARGYGFMRVVWPELDYPATVRKVLHGHVLRARTGFAA